MKGGGGGGGPYNMAPERSGQVWSLYKSTTFVVTFSQQGSCLGPIEVKLDRVLSFSLVVSRPLGQ